MAFIFIKQDKTRKLNELSQIPVYVHKESCL